MSSADDPDGDSLGVIPAVAAAVAFIVLNGLLVDALKLGLGEVLLLEFVTAFVLGWLVPSIGIVLVVGVTFALWAATGTYFGSGGEIDVRPVPSALMLLVVALTVRAGFWLGRREWRPAGAKVRRRV